MTLGNMADSPITVIQQSTLAEVREEQDGSCAALDELMTFGDFVTCRDAETPITLIRPPKTLPKEMLLALDEIYTCGEFFGCRDP